MLEKDIENWLNKQIEQLGGLAFKFVSPGNPGVPDRIYILPDGKVWFVELKQQLGEVAEGTLNPPGLQLPSGERYGGRQGLCRRNERCITNRMIIRDMQRKRL